MRLEREHHLLAELAKAAVFEILRLLGAAPAFEDPHDLAHGFIKYRSIPTEFGRVMPLLHQFIAFRQPALPLSQAAALAGEAAKAGPVARI